MANCTMCTKFGECPWQTNPNSYCSAYEQRAMTNADRIRSMTNWEMAKFFVRFFDEANADCKKLPCNKCCAGKLCSEGILDWLNEENE